MTQINYILHINTFFAVSKSDKRLRAFDISLYMALFQEWNQQRFPPVITIKREDIMAASHIGSRDKYVQCLRNLHNYGYILYEASKHVYEHSKVTICLLAAPKTGPQEGANIGPYAWPGIGPQPWPESEPHKGPDPGHIYKHINKNKTEQTWPSHKIPSIKQVLEFFQAAGAPAGEGRKFFNHYEGVNWQLSRQPIVNWKAVANKWLENISTFKIITHDETGEVHKKDYAAEL
jgi:hypothetical protein